MCWVCVARAAPAHAPTTWPSLLNFNPEPRPHSPLSPQGEVATLRNAAAGALGEAEERLRAALADYEALQR